MMMKNYRKSEFWIRNTSRADAGNYVGHKEGKPADDENPHHLDMSIDHHHDDVNGDNDDEDFESMIVVLLSIFMSSQESSDHDLILKLII